MSDFNQDMQNLLNAYDSNWDDYLALRKQFIEKYSVSVEKLEPIGYYNKAHGFLHDEFDKDCYCQGGCSMEAVYTESQVKKLTGENKVGKLQEQLNTAKKALTEIRANIEEHNQIYDLSTDTALLLEGIDGIAFEALEAEEEEND